MALFCPILFSLFTSFCLGLTLYSSPSLFSHLLSLYFIYSFHQPPWLASFLPFFFPLLCLSIHLMAFHLFPFILPLPASQLLSVCNLPVTSCPPYILPFTSPSLFLPAFISDITSWMVPFNFLFLPSSLHPFYLYCILSPPAFLLLFPHPFSSLLTSSFLLSSPSPPPVPPACQKPQRLWVVEAVPFLLQWGLRQDDHQHHRRGLCLPEWILGLHWKACHYAVDWQVEGHTWGHTYTPS